MYGWHFLRDNRMLRTYQSAPPQGRWLRHWGRVIAGSRGLHCANTIKQALRFAPGPWLCYVELVGRLQRHATFPGITAGRCRLIIAEGNVNGLLRSYLTKALYHWGQQFHFPERVLQTLERCCDNGGIYPLPYRSAPLAELFNWLQTLSTQDYCPQRDVPASGRSRAAELLAQVWLDHRTIWSAAKLAVSESADGLLPAVPPELDQQLLLGVSQQLGLLPTPCAERLRDST